MGPIEAITTRWTLTVAYFVSQQPDSADPSAFPTGSGELTLRDTQRSVDAWIRQYGVRYFSELTNLAQLMEEVGELARIISRQYGEQSNKASDSGSLADELADVLFVLTCLANQTGVDLTEAFQRNLQKKTRRDAERHLNNPRLRTPSSERAS